MAQHKDRNKRPVGTQVDFTAVPEELRVLKQWVTWRYDWIVSNGSWAKVPYQTNGQKAASDNPETWATFDSVMVTYEQSRSSYDGIGFMFDPTSGYVGVDVDNCVTDDGEHHLSPLASRIVERLNTYTEMSPSLTGIHCIGRAEAFQGFNKNFKGDKIEGYSKGRYFTFTGRSWDEHPREIRDIDADLKAIIAAISKPEPKNAELPSVQVAVLVDERLKMALKDPKTNSLFWGNTLEYGGDDSAADMALCNKLAYYSGGSESDLDAMFRQSKLMRPKWDERRGARTYGEITLQEALTSCTRFFGSKPKDQPKETEYDSRKLRRFTMADLSEKAIEYYRSGASRGVDPGWPSLEPLYRPAKSLMSIITGEPGSGKSNWVDCLCYKIAEQHKWGITFASFETLPIERHVLTLAQIYLKKPTFRWMQGAATEDELMKAIEALNDYFHFILPDEHELTIEAILEYVDDDIRDYGIQGFVLDPFTELDNGRSGSMTQTEMIEKVLRKLQLFTRQRQIHTWLIAHPTKAGDTYRDGRPTMRSISGSANFYNKADFGLIMHRHEDDRSTLYIDKVRFDSTGTRGKVDFFYSKERREYFCPLT